MSHGYSAKKKKRCHMVRKIRYTQIKEHNTGIQRPSRTFSQIYASINFHRTTLIIAKPYKELPQAYLDSFQTEQQYVHPEATQKVVSSIHNLRVVTF